MGRPPITLGLKGTQGQQKGFIGGTETPNHGGYTLQLSSRWLNEADLEIC